MNKKLKTIHEYFCKHDWKPLIKIDYVPFAAYKKNRDHGTVFYCSCGVYGSTFTSSKLDKIPEIISPSFSKSFVICAYNNMPDEHKESYWNFIYSLRW